MKPASLGPAGLALAAALALCVLTPPDIRGLSLAAVSVLALIAAFATSGAWASSAAFRSLLLMLPAAMIAGRAGIAPGKAVEPVACLGLAVLAGLSASALPGLLDRIVPMLAVFVAWLGGRALYEVFWGFPALAAQLRGTAVDPALINRVEQGRPYGGFITPAALGCALVVMIPPVAAWSMGRKGWQRTAGLAAAGLGAAGLVATFSVTAMTALCGSLALFSLRKRRVLRVAAVAGAVLAAGIIFAGILRPDAVFNPTRTDSPWRLRVGNVRIALEIARDHPLLGAGPGGYGEAFPLYRSAGDNESHHAHDLPAELAAEWGIPMGAALSLAFFAAFLWPVLRVGGDSGTAASGCTIGLAAFALHNVADFTAFVPSLLVVASLLRGCVAEAETRERSPWPARALAIAVALGIAALATTSGLARDALFEARSAAISGDHATGLRLAARAAALAPWDPDAPAVSAAARMAAGSTEPDIALADADRAVSLAPARASLRWLRARARSAAGDSAGAFGDLDTAARLYPAHDSYATEAAALADALRKAREAAPK